MKSEMENLLNKIHREHILLCDVTWNFHDKKKQEQPLFLQPTRGQCCHSDCQLSWNFQLSVSQFETTMKYEHGLYRWHICRQSTRRATWLTIQMQRHPLSVLSRPLMIHRSAADISQIFTAKNTNVDCRRKNDRTNKKRNSQPLWGTGMYSILSQT